MGKAEAPQDRLLHDGSHFTHKPEVKDGLRAPEGLGGREVPSVMEESVKAPPRPCWCCAEGPGLLCSTGVGLLGPREPRTRWLTCVFKGSIFRAAGVASAPGACAGEANSSCCSGPFCAARWRAPRFGDFDIFPFLNCRCFHNWPPGECESV